MHEWIITTDIGQYGVASSQDHVIAEYVKVDEGDWLEFKDSNHKTVYLVSSRHVVSVTRTT